VERGPYGRDLSLTLRMLFVSAVLLALYGTLAFLAGWTVYEGWNEDWRALGVPALLLAGIYAHFAGADRLVLSAARARTVERGEEPELHALVDRLAGMGDLPAPRIAVSELEVPNAFAAGIRQSRATVVVTRGLLERLEPDEVEAVLGHELAHIANRDAMVITAASLFPTVGAWLGRWRFGGRDFSKRERDWREYLLWPFEMLIGLTFYVFGTLLTFTVSRYREYAADRGSALATGHPENLMSALQKVAAETALIPRRDLRALSGLNAFFIVSVRAHRFVLNMDHPPLEKRLARLAEIARELGKAVR
jgi:heat shock protein HtpX